MRVPASPLLVFGFALAATEGWSAPASPVMGHSPRMANSPALPNSPAFPNQARSGGAVARTLKGGDGFSGAGGQANGRGLDETLAKHRGGGLLGLGLFSGNAGNGGKASSGASVGGNGGVAAVYDSNGKLQSGIPGDGGAAYSGAGGVANGGSITERELLNGLNILSLGGDGILPAGEPATNESNNGVNGDPKPTDPISQVLGGALDKGNTDGGSGDQSDSKGQPGTEVDAHAKTGKSGLLDGDVASLGEYWDTLGSGPGLLGGLLGSGDGSDPSGGDVLSGLVGDGNPILVAATLSTGPGGEKDLLGIIPTDMRRSRVQL